MVQTGWSKRIFDLFDLTGWSVHLPKPSTGAVVGSEEQRVAKRRQVAGIRIGIAGGKIGDGETSVEALSRELAEELGIEVTACASFMNLRHEYDDRIVTIEFFIVSDWKSDPVGREGQALRWVPRERLDADELLPADVPVIEALQKNH